MLISRELYFLITDSTMNMIEFATTEFSDIWSRIRTQSNISRSILRRIHQLNVTHLSREDVLVKQLLASQYSTRMLYLLFDCLFSYLSGEHLINAKRLTFKRTNVSCCG